MPPNRRISGPQYASGNLGIQCILARSLGFHAIAFEHSSCMIIIFLKSVIAIINMLTCWYMLLCGFVVVSGRKQGN